MCSHSILAYPYSSLSTLDYGHVLGSVFSRKPEAPLGQVLPLSCSSIVVMALVHSRAMNEWMNDVYEPAMDLCLEARELENVNNTDVLILEKN